MARHLPGDGLVEGDHPALGPGVDRLHRGAHPPGVGGDADQPAPGHLDHPRQRRPGHPHRPHEVDVEDAPGELLVGVEEGLELVPAGTVHAHPDHPELGAHPGHGVADRRRAGDVEPHAEARAKEGLLDVVRGECVAGK